MKKKMAGRRKTPWCKGKGSHSGKPHGDKGEKGHDSQVGNPSYGFEKVPSPPPKEGGNFGRRKLGGGKLPKP